MVEDENGPRDQLSVRYALQVHPDIIPPYEHTSIDLGMSVRKRDRVLLLGDDTIFDFDVAPIGGDSNIILSTLSKARTSTATRNSVKLTIYYLWATAAV